jgi:hypothetical protein
MGDWGTNPPPATNLKHLPFNHLKLFAAVVRTCNRLPFGSHPSKPAFLFAIFGLESTIFTTLFAALSCLRLSRCNGRRGLDVGVSQQFPLHLDGSAWPFQALQLAAIRAGSRTVQDL